MDGEHSLPLTVANASPVVQFHVLNETSTNFKPGTLYKICAVVAPCFAADSKFEFLEWWGSAAAGTFVNGTLLSTRFPWLVWPLMQAVCLADAEKHYTDNQMRDKFLIRSSWPASRLQHLIQNGSAIRAASALQYVSTEVDDNLLQRILAQPEFIELGERNSTNENIMDNKSADSIAQRSSEPVESGEPAQPSVVAAQPVDAAQPDEAQLEDWERYVSLWLAIFA